MSKDIVEEIHMNILAVLKLVAKLLFQTRRNPYESAALIFWVSTVYAHRYKEHGVVRQTSCKTPRPGIEPGFSA